MIRIKQKFFSMLLAVLLLAGTTGLVGCSAPFNADGNGESSPSDRDNIVHLTAENFEAEVLHTEKTVLLDFYADWCGPCQRLDPILEEIAAERPDIIIGKIDVDEETALANTYGIESMPTLIVMKNGNIVKKVIGYRPKAELITLLDID